MSEMKNKVTKKTSTTVGMVSKFEAVASRGLENIRQEDKGMPTLKLLQNGSPEVNKNDGRYIKDAQPGMMLDPAGDTLYNGEEGVRVVPFAFGVQYVEWADRGTGPKSPIAFHAITSDVLGETVKDGSYKDRLPNGNYLEKTAYHFVLLVPEGTAPKPAMVTFKSTNLKVSRRWNNLMTDVQFKGQNSYFTPPSFSHYYKLKSSQQSNDKGSWYNWGIERLQPLEDGTDDALFEKALKLSESFDHKMIKTQIAGPKESSN
tara:strand:+ start:51 stop:830 length:780 start_codon:yes stop_codon:yes gene_type:complete